MAGNCETTNQKQSLDSSMPSDLTQSSSEPIRSGLLVAATGLGKTVMLAELARLWPVGRVVMISHRSELNQQSLKSLSDICGEEVDLEQAGYIADQRCKRTRLVVASVQTLNSRQRKSTRLRYERFDPLEFGLLMIDEAHRATARSYRRVIEHFRQNPNLYVVGVTATPDRLDGVGMGCVFDRTIINLDLLWGIEQGWLVAPRQLFVRVDGLDLSKVRTVAGDLDEKQLAKLVEVEENLHAMAKPIVDVCGSDKQAIVFAASVAQARRLAEMIRDYHQRQFGRPGLAVSLDGELSPQDAKRVQIVKDFKAGRIQYLVNCGVATEGFDAPNVRVVAIGRPTKSRALYLQMLGRGTRPLPGTVDGLCSPEERLAAIKTSAKPQCTVIDFQGQAGRHKLVCSTDFMVGEKTPQEVKDRANRISSGRSFDGTQLDAIKLAREQLDAEREARRAKITAGVDYKLVDQGSLYEICTIAEKRVPGYLKRNPPTSKQLSMLLRLGYTSAQIAKLNSKTASLAIDQAIQNPKTQFGRWLKRNKSSSDVEARR